MTEEWSSVKGYEGYYEVSNLGRVRSITRKVVGRRGILKGKFISLGVGVYPSVELWNSGKFKRMLVHRLVLESFVGPSNGLQCNHKDGNKWNPKLSNLEWCTPKENHQHAWSTGLHKTYQDRKVIRNDGVIFNSIKEAAFCIGASQGNLWMVCNGKRNHTKGYSFKYIGEKYVNRNSR